MNKNNSMEEYMDCYKEETNNITIKQLQPKFVEFGCFISAKLGYVPEESTTEELFLLWVEE